jgi:hypothetical protein
MVGAAGVSQGEQISDRFGSTCSACYRVEAGVILRTEGFGPEPQSMNRYAAASAATAMGAVTRVAASWFFTWAQAAPSIS